MNPALLIVAKAPVAGLAKTRLSPPATPRQAAAIAAAALLDTLDAARRTGLRTVVALTGQLEDAERAADLRRALRPATVIPQRGATFAERLANAHADTGGPVLQIGMDTPQVTPALLSTAADRLTARTADAVDAADAVLGLATDGGWWALGLRDPDAAAALLTVPMSRPDTGARTLDALRRRDLTVGLLPELSDVDTIADAVLVAAGCGTGRFPAAVRAVAA